MKRGFPRPLTKIEKTSSNLSRSARNTTGSYGKKWDGRNYPHPYAATEENLARISTGRKAECVKFKRCMNCGEVVKEDIVGLILYNPRSRMGMKFDDFIHHESGPYHFKCLIQSMTMCPHLATNKRFMAGSGEWSVVKPLIAAYLTD